MSQFQDFAQADPDKQTRRENSNKFYGTPIFRLIIFISAITFAGLILVSLSIIYRTKTVEIRKLYIKKLELESQVIPMLMQEEQLTKLNVVENYALKNLGMIYPDKTKVIKLYTKDDNTNH